MRSLWVLVFLGVATAAQADVPSRTAEPIARMVLQEANTETFLGKVVVAGVALDRMEDPRWPATEHAVVYQPWQFTGMHNRFGRYTAANVAEARAAVRSAKAGLRPCGRALWYHNGNVLPAWTKRLQVNCRIGRHIFYGDFP
jgi:N-acetylmuramoyl-L-alanine amidase